jgi:hydroxymethylpyrimidine pyrophosphatase-like HAD family hydrolase
VVFGDDVNDIGMMKAADRPIAMANAKSEVKALAREVIGTNNDDSVVRAIRQDWSRRGGR